MPCGLVLVDVCQGTKEELSKLANPAYYIARRIPVSNPQKV